MKLPSTAHLEKAEKEAARSEDPKAIASAKAKSAAWATYAAASEKSDRAQAEADELEEEREEKARKIAKLCFGFSLFMVLILCVCGGNLFSGTSFLELGSVHHASLDGHGESFPPWWGLLSAVAGSSWEVGMNHMRVVKPLPQYRSCLSAQTESRPHEIF